MSQLFGGGGAGVDPMGNSGMNDTTGAGSLLDQLLGSAPEERSKNLKAISKALAGMSQMTASSKDSTLTQRLGEFARANPQILQSQRKDVNIQDSLDPAIAARLLRDSGIY